LIPQLAISTVRSCPAPPCVSAQHAGRRAFGQDKSGHDDPGTELEAYGDRSATLFRRETGGEFGNFDYFLTGDYFDETGWRDNSPSRGIRDSARSGGKTTNRHRLSYTYADTSSNLATAQFRRACSLTGVSELHAGLHGVISHFVKPHRYAVLTDQMLLSGNVLLSPFDHERINGNVMTATSRITPGLLRLRRAGRAWGFDLLLAGPGCQSTLLQRTLGAPSATDSQTLFGWTIRLVLARITVIPRRILRGVSVWRTICGSILIYVTSPFNDERSFPHGQQ